MSKITLREVMSAKPVTVQTQDPLSEVREVFSKHSIHHIPVIDENRQIVGIISSSDLDRLSWGSTLFKNVKKAEYNKALHQTYRVLDVMTADVYTLDADQTINEAYHIFKEGLFRAIPILENGKLVGIVSPIDLVKPFISKAKVANG